MCVVVRGEQREGAGRKGGRLVEKTYTFLECGRMILLYSFFIVVAYTSQGSSGSVRYFWTAVLLLQLRDLTHSPFPKFGDLKAMNSF